MLGTRVWYDLGAACAPLEFTAFLFFLEARLVRTQTVADVAPGALASAWIRLAECARRRHAAPRLVAFGHAVGEPGGSGRARREALAESRRGLGLALAQARLVVRILAAVRLHTFRQRRGALPVRACRGLLECVRVVDALGEHARVAHRINLLQIMLARYLAEGAREMKISRHSA